MSGVHGILLWMPDGKTRLIAVMFRTSVICLTRVQMSMPAIIMDRRP